MKPVICKHCGAVDRHHSIQCFQAPKTAIKQKTRPVRSTKPITQNGATKKKWLATRHAWLKANIPNHTGHYLCHYCHKSVDYTEITLDHLIPRSRAPHLRYEHSNLVPSCAPCNLLKGSIAHDEYAHSCHMLR